MKALHDILTGIDGESHDVARWSWVLCQLAETLGALWNAWHSGAFELATFAQSSGVIAAAHSAAIFAKQQTEPKG